MFITKSCSYALTFFAIAITFTSCNVGSSNDGPPIPTDSAQPVVQPLTFSAPKKTGAAAVKPVAIKPPSTKISWDKLPEEDYDTTTFRPFAYPFEEKKFSFRSLPARALDIDKLSSKPIKFKTYILPAPKLIKGAKPQVKNGNLYLLGIGENQKTAGTEITCLLHDKDGFLWIACAQGLYRYDGENLMQYLRYPDYTYDFGMVLDDQGNIWMPDSFGPLLILDPKGGTLKKALPHEGLDSLRHLMVDDDKRIWGTSQYGGVKIIDIKEQNVKVLDKAHKQLASNWSTGITRDKDGNIWISTGGDGIHIVDLKNKKIKHLDIVHGLFSDWLSNVVCDSAGRLWAGMYQGLIHVIDPKKNVIQTISEMHSVASGLYITCFTQDTRGRMWAGTNGNGAGVIDLAHRRVMHLRKDDGLGSDNVSDIKHDNEGQAWIGTDLGLNVVSNNKALIEHIGTDTISNLMEDRDGLIWEATANGVVIVDHKKKTIKRLGMRQGLANDAVHFIKETNDGVFISTENSLEILDVAKTTITHLESSYNDVLFDKAGQVWYLDGTGRGLNLYNPKNQTIKHFGKSELQLNDFIESMCLDGQGRVWLSSGGGQVGIIDPGAGTIQFLTNIKGAKYSTINFLPDDKGNIWMGTDAGICVADLKDQNIVYFSVGQGLMSDKVLSLRLHNGSVYAGTAQGVTVITPPAGGVSAQEKWIVTSYGSVKKFSSNYNADLVTRNGIYLSGDAGITEFRLDKKDTAKSAPYIKGITVADHPVYFLDKSRFKLSGSDTLWQPNDEGHFSNGETPVNTSYAYQSGLKWDKVTGSDNMPVHLTIPYGQNSVHFHYGNLNLAPHDTTRYRYMLKGADKNWNEITSDTATANYVNLQPGAYTFLLVSRNADNMWSKPVKFRFTINPPVWQTWWAYIVYFFLFVWALRTFVRFRSRQLEKEKRELENRVRLATEEVTKQKREIESQRDNLEVQRNSLEKTLGELKTTQNQLIQSEKMASLGELTAGIAHEIQNPLNFVNNFSEVNQEMIDELEEELKAGNLEDALAIAADIKQNEERINHHGKRADSIVKGMLEHSRTQSGQKEPADINAIADEYLRLAYHGLRAKDKMFNAEMVTRFNPSLPKINVVPQDIGRVLLNIFSNAFYAVNQKKKTAGDGYKPEVSVETLLEKNNVVIKIKDNGTGIPDAIKEKIMQPFFTTKQTGEGTGLGLSLAYDMVVKGHGGSIEVNTKEGEFTEFIISVPLN